MLDTICCAWLGINCLCMGQTRSLSKAQHRLQVNLHISLVCIITIGPASSLGLGGAGTPWVLLNSKYLFLFHTVLPSLLIITPNYFLASTFSMTSTPIFTSHSSLQSLATLITLVFLQFTFSSYMQWHSGSIDFAQFSNWGAKGAPILFSVLGYRMASCS